MIFLTVLLHTTLDPQGPLCEFLTVRTGHSLQLTSHSTYPPERLKGTDQDWSVAMMSKLALLLALAIGGLALCNGQGSPSPSFTCPGGGVADESNNDNIVPTCVDGSVLCRTDGLEGQGQDCPGNGSCTATCVEGVSLILTDENGTITIAPEGGTVVEVTKVTGIFKGTGGNCGYAYCTISEDDIPTTPTEVSTGLSCALGYAAFCYTPGGLLPPPPTPSPPPPRSPPPPPRVCQCDNKKVTFKWKGSPVMDISLCPGSPLPDKNKYTAKDNCGNYLRVKVHDSLRRPNRGPCCSMTRTLTAQCGYSEVTKNQKVTFGDRVTFSSSRGAVKARCKCRSGEKVLTPKNFYRNGRVFKAVYKVKDVCGIEHTKTVTKY